MGKGFGWLVGGSDVEIKELVGWLLGVRVWEVEGVGGLWEIEEVGRFEGLWVFDVKRGYDCFW